MQKVEPNQGIIVVKKLVRYVILPDKPARTHVLVKQEEYSRLLMDVVGTNTRRKINIYIYIYIYIYLL